MAKAAQWAMDAARKAARIELRDGLGLRCSDADEAMDEYTFEVFDPTTSDVVAFVNVTEGSVDFIAA